MTTSSATSSVYTASNINWITAGFMVTFHALAVMALWQFSWTNLVVALILYWLGGARPQTPNLERFMDGSEPAWYSPPLLARVRSLPAHAVLAEDAAGA